MGIAHLCRVFEDAREHLALLMQLLTLEPELAAYNMRMMTTKCLNTAVMTMVLYLGMSRALTYTRFCDVQNVKARRSVANASDLWSTVMSKIEPSKRILHYVMLTDGDLALPDKDMGTVYFPGHVFVIEHGGSDDSYKLYQSYIDKYDLDQHIRHRGGSLELNRAQMKLIMDAVKQFVSTDIWSEQCSRDFALLTHVQPEVFQTSFGGARKAGAILLCHTTVEFQGGCTGELLAYVDRKLKDVAAYGSESSTYGDPSMYANDAKPLTRAQVRSGLADLRAMLLSNNTIE